MINPEFAYTSGWLYDQEGVSPMFRVVDELLNDESLGEDELCRAIFDAGKMYKSDECDSQQGLLESLFDSLAICEYILTLEPSPKHANLILICMEYYLKASLFKLDEWLNPGNISESQLQQLETELPLILNKLNRVRA